jgi:hypothetical protein
VERVSSIFLGYTKERTFLKVSKVFLLGLLACVETASSSEEYVSDRRYTGELHPPVIASWGDDKIAVLFLKNEFKNSIADHYVADGEMYYFSLRPLAPKLEYVWKIEGDEVVSVFFYEWKSPVRTGKSMFLLAKDIVSNAAFEGVSYSVTEFPLIKDGNGLELVYFKGGHQDDRLRNCLDGIDHEKNKTLSCEYKNAGSVKRYLKSQDK